MTAVSADTTPASDSQSSMNDAELLPCPFCGGEARMEGRVNGWIVACENRQLGDGCPVNMRTHHTIDKATAAALWNTRASKAEIDDLRAALSAIWEHLGSAETHDAVIDNITRTALEKDWSSKAVAS